MVYKKTKELGRGGFGIVDEVTDDNGVRLARKTLSSPVNLDAASVKKRFDREVKYQGALVHENVAQILDHNLSADPPWFIMPLALKSLQDELSADRTMNGDPKTALFHILNGLEEIHRRGFCHRDLKPANVLKLSKPDGSTFYALSDFGLMAIGEDASSTLTPSGIGGGTLQYQAPECAINFHRATPRSDIYSFGALLHDIFSTNPKRLPHEELTAPGDVGPVIEKCTKKNAYRRYKNVSELREALYKALSTFVFKFESGEEEQVVTLLVDDTNLPNPEQWDRIFDFLDSNLKNAHAVRNVFMALRQDHVDHLHNNDPDLMAALGKLFANHCRDGFFSFDYCDVLASKAQRFFDLGELDLKAEISIAMLKLGTTHNRWFVERKFLQMAGKNAEDALAERIIVELDVLNVDFKQQFAHVAGSIGAEKEQLHYALQSLLN